MSISSFNVSIYFKLQIITTVLQPPSQHPTHPQKKMKKKKELRILSGLQKDKFEG